VIKLWNGIDDGDMLDAIASELGLISEDWCRMQIGGTASNVSTVFVSAKVQYSIRCWKVPDSAEFCGIVVYIYDGGLIIDQLDRLELNDPNFLDNLMSVITELKEFGFSYDRYVVEKLRHYKMQRIPGGVHVTTHIEDLT